MNSSAEHKAINDALNNYEAQLEKIPDDLFTETPLEGGWSFAEVYSHILQATLGSSIALQRCANGTSAPSNKGLTFLGRLMMFTGQFPPFKVKVPKALEGKMPVNKISKDEAKNLLMKCRKRIDDVTPLVASAADNSRQQHPRLGMLNGRQWFKFIRIHLNHHLKQLARIEKSFNANETFFI